VVRSRAYSMGGLWKGIPVESVSQHYVPLQLAPKVYWFDPEEMTRILSPTD